MNEHLEQPGLVVIQKAAFFLASFTALPRTTVLTYIPTLETDMPTLTAEMVNDASAAQLSGPPALLLIKSYFAE